MAMDALRGVVARGSRANTLLRAALVVIAVPFFVLSDIVHLGGYTLGVDLEIMLRAAERWRDGGEPYLLSAFSAPAGADQPFLYPPYFLPPVSVLASLPRTLAIGLGIAMCVVSLVVVLRRLGVPVVVWPLVLAWPPTVEAVISSNPQLPAVACFAIAFWLPSAARWPAVPFARRFGDRGTGLIAAGFAAAASVALKISHPHAWVYVFRRRPAEALAGAAIVGALVGLTVPITGLEPWDAWLTDLRAATDPTWPLGGLAIARLVNVVVGSVLFAATVGLVISFLPARHAGAWIGLLTVVGAPSLHNFGLLFLLPALLLIRAEIALVAAIFMATTSYEGSWAGIAVVGVALLIGRHRASWLEAVPTGAEALRRASGRSYRAAGPHRGEDETHRQPQQR